MDLDALPAVRQRLSGLMSPSVVFEYKYDMLHEEGFEYPQIDESKCVRCYQCLKVCPFKVAKASEM